MKALFDAVHTAFHRPSATSYKWVQGAVWVLIAVSILLVMIELAAITYPTLAKLDGLQRLDNVLLVIFGVEISLRVLSYRPPQLDLFNLRADERLRTHILSRLWFCLQPLNLIDIITVLAVLPQLRGLRALRLLRLLRTTKIFRYSHPLRGTARAFQDNAVLYAFAFSVLGLETLVGGVSIWLIERANSGNPVVNANIVGLSDGLWWALVTLTTVGFGDISPVSGLGRIVGGVLMVAGMFTLALFAGIVGQSLLNSVLTLREEQFRMSSTTHHVVIFGYDPAARMLLQAILEEVNPEETPLIIFADAERPHGLPPEFTWVRGDPTKESELDKARLEHASTLVLVGSRAVSPQQADGVTILTAFTIRSFLEKRAQVQRRTKPLYIVAEILDSENVAHARTAGADEVIETTRLGFSLISHAITMPGTASVMSTVASAGAHSLYTTPAPALPRADGGPATFHDISEHFKRTHGALVIGVRDARSGEQRLNPPDATAIRPGDQLLYLAEGAIKVQ